MVENPATEDKPYEKPRRLEYVMSTFGGSSFPEGATPAYRAKVSGTNDYVAQTTGDKFFRFIKHNQMNIEDYKFLNYMASYLDRRMMATGSTSRSSSRSS